MENVTAHNVLYILGLEGEKAMHDLFKMFLNLDDVVNVPQYPGYPGYQLLEALGQVCNFERSG